MNQKLLNSIRFAIIILISNFIASACKAQEPAADELNGYIHTMRSINPADEDFSDLMYLKNEIGSSKIVMLGELTHGDGTTFEAKVRLIKFLHREMGFNVLAFESGMYDCARIFNNALAGAKTSDEVRSSLFYMYAESEQVKPLFDYIDLHKNGKTPLYLAGGESMHTGKKSEMLLFEDFEKFYRPHNKTLLASEDWKTYRNFCQAAIKMDRSKPIQSELDIYLKIYSELKKSLSIMNIESKISLESSGFWLKIIESLHSMVRRYKIEPASMDFAIRDAQSAENYSYLFDKQYKNQKMIIWAHNIHVMRCLNKIEGFPDPQFKPFGEWLYEKYGNNVFTIAFTTYNGQFLDYASDKIVTLPQSPAESAESFLFARKAEYAFINVRKMKDNNPFLKRVSALSENRQVNTLFKQHFDGLFFIATTKPAVRK